MLKHGLKKSKNIIGYNYKKSLGEIKKILEFKKHKILTFFDQTTIAKNAAEAYKVVEIKKLKYLEFIKIRPAIARLIIEEKDILEDLIFNNNIKYEYKIRNVIDRNSYYVILYINYDRIGNNLTKTKAVINSWIHHDSELFEKIKNAYHAFNERYDIDYISIKSIVIDLLIHKEKPNESYDG